MVNIAQKLALATSALSATVSAVIVSQNSSYDNPIIPGFHPDPSCVFVDELDKTFFCASSSFLAFPGIPIHASKDLVDWKLVSHVFNRLEQLPSFAEFGDEQDGWFAPTLRFRNGTFYVVSTALQSAPSFALNNAIFTTTNPYDDASWSLPISFGLFGIDPSLFWDQSGQAYVQGTTSTEIVQARIDLKTGNVSTFVNIWNGTGAVNPEGPHMYFKDGYHYLLIAEGGTDLGHRATIARSKNVTGPFESYPGNPLLTNANTTEYFQAVGHADLFQDATGNWWGVSLARRSGLTSTYPMGRETCLFPVTWNKGQWPVVDQVRGRMSGPLPSRNKLVDGLGAFVTDPDAYFFLPGSSIPKHFVYWRPPHSQNYQISPTGHPFTLRLLPSSANLTGPAVFNASLGQTFIARRQTDTLFTFSVNVDFAPAAAGDETGVTVFTTRFQHIDLGVVKTNATAGLAAGIYFRFGSEGSGALPTTYTLVPTTWLGHQLKFKISAFNITHFSFSAGLGSDSRSMRVFGVAPASIISGGFTGNLPDHRPRCCDVTDTVIGALIGTYTTSNGVARGSTPSYVSQWSYIGQGQYIGDGQYY